MIAVYDFAELFAKPLAGVVADRYGMKRMLLTGLVVFIFGSALFLVISPKSSSRVWGSGPSGPTATHS